MTHPDRWRFSGLDLRASLIDGAPTAQDDPDSARDPRRDDLLADWDDGWRADDLDDDRFTDDADVPDNDDDDPRNLDADDTADPQEDLGDPAVDYSADDGGDTSADFPADPTGPAATGFKRRP